MSDFSGVFSILPAWGNKTFKEDKYGIYIIGKNRWFGYNVGMSYNSAEEAIQEFSKIIKVLRQKYPTEQDYFNALQNANSGDGMVVPKALKKYVQTALEEYGDKYR